MFRSSMFAALLLVTAASASYAQQGAVAKGPDGIKVTVTGVRSAQGRIRVELWASPDGFPRKNENAAETVWIDAAQAAQGAVTTDFQDLQPGHYAIAAMHDENNNGKLDTSVFGTPKEGWAVSNDAVSHTHAPRFEEAEINVTAPDQVTTLKMHY